MQILDFQNKVLIVSSLGFNLSCGGFADNLWTDSFCQRFGLTVFSSEEEIVGGEFFAILKFAKKKMYGLREKSKFLLDVLVQV